MVSNYYLYSTLLNFVVLKCILHKNLIWIDFSDVPFDPVEKPLTGLVVLSFAGDFERVDVEAQVPRHRLQQQHREGAVRVKVVYHRVDLPRVQPVAGHVALRVKQRA